MENILHEEQSRELALFSLEREDENNVTAAFLYTELNVHHVHDRQTRRWSFNLQQKVLLPYWEKAVSWKAVIW